METPLSSELGQPVRCRPDQRARPWAGSRLGSPGDSIGEAWLAGPDSVVDGGAWDGMTLDAIAARAGAAFTGDRSVALLGPRFPLLVKVIDAADWLSLQVHPDDALATELYGPGQLGKTEAWVILDSSPGATFVTGPGRQLREPDLRHAIAAGTLDRSMCEVEDVEVGETRLIRAGTIHAIGAGVFVYEIEQPSDLTFRISDWGRPPVPGRDLHREESLRALRPERHAERMGDGWRVATGGLGIREFDLRIESAAEPTTRHPAGQSLEVVTAIRGTVELVGPDWRVALGPYETCVVPAVVEEYRIEGDPAGLACIGFVPEAR